MGSFQYAKDKEDYYTVGIGFDAWYLAPGIEIGYKINSYTGVRIGAQYISTSNLKNIRAEKKIYSQMDKEYRSRLSYSNFFAPIMLDIYPLENDFRVTVGAGYMKRTFTDKKHNNTLSNDTKFVAIANISYAGLFSNEYGYGYNLEFGTKFLNDKLKSKVKTKDKWKFVPTIKLGISYKL